MLVSNYVSPFPQTERNAGLKLRRPFSPDREECWSQTRPHLLQVLLHTMAKSDFPKWEKDELHVLDKLSKTKCMCVDKFKVHKSDLSILHTIIMPTFGWSQLKGSMSHPCGLGTRLVRMWPIHSLAEKIQTVTKVAGCLSYAIDTPGEWGRLGTWPVEGVTLAHDESHCTSAYNKYIQLKCKLFMVVSNFLHANNSPTFLATSFGRLAKYALQYIHTASN